MNPHSRFLPATPNLPRRRFLQGLAAGGILLGAPSLILPASAREAGTAAGSAPVLSGTEFDLTIAETAVNFTGKPRMATTINGSIPGPTLRLREGDTVTIRVHNRLTEDTSIHWHGILLPFEMDGVPGISFKGIPPGQTFTYRFKVKQTGTYWYHSHSGMQEQTGMYGTIIIDPARGNSVGADRDYVVQLSDWTDEHPMRVLHKLKVQGDYFNFNQPTAGDFFRDVSKEGLKAAIDKRRMWNEMRMSPTDLADVSAHTYTYLMNGAAPAGNWTGLFRPGGKVRLRFVNSAAMTFFDVRIPGLKMTVVQTDGQDVEPVTVDEIRIGVAETYDVIVSPKDEAYTIFAQSMDRTGFARGTLATRAGLVAAVPSPDKPVALEMQDMMGDMTGLARAHHARTEYGPSVDMRVDTPRTDLDDPGVGLRDNGRRVLTYDHLHSVGGPLDARGPGREIELHLTGNMERYAWSIDGVEFEKSTPVHFRHNERLRVVFVNDTMMTHPMHLHGMWSELESPEGKFQVRKHTIAVQPAQRVSFLVTADALGRWAWHCHLGLHMDMGMFREVVVA
ncbi:Copper-resistance protein CopA [Thiobacillus denitrificans ATCC 25259]|uniref:Copper-containing nitrite reductase n=1 Tax=Thiobacillus denitrificans (strain ATCC 25259 / T1) TaxID=292415 RepID=Q3SJ90_THIDA|nr:copper resistance system multicopper oxidase [Thiobacillus denitrificans]AAZ97277.1 Copper-resistance protein CopA [Thiobacillus denitrificans ATCC 25259]